MTARPDDFPDFATDTNFTNGPDAGTATKVEPSAGELAEGHIRETAPSAQKENWWKNLVGKWTNYLDEQLIALHVQVDQQPALNFRSSTNTFGIVSAFFNPVYNSWVVVGASENAKETLDLGASWSSSSFVAAAGSGESCCHGSADPSGNAVIATLTRYVFQRTKSTDSVTRVDVHGSAATMTEAQVAYDSVRAKWVWWATDGSSSTKSSSDRTTWSSATNPSFAGDGSFTNRMVANPTTGRILFVDRNGSPNRIYIGRTDDAATTWSFTTYISIASWTPDTVWLSYNESGGYWLLSASSTSDSVCKVWTSADDGVTWTEVSSLTTAMITSIAGIGSLWVALAKGLDPSSNDNHDVLWSTDGGDTWTRAGYGIFEANGLHAAAGGFLVTTIGGLAFFSHRMHAPSLGVAT